MAVSVRNNQATFGCRSSSSADDVARLLNHENASACSGRRTWRTEKRLVADRNSVSPHSKLLIRGRHASNTSLDTDNSCVSKSEIDCADEKVVVT